MNVLLIDDHPIVRSGLRLLLETMAGAKVEDAASAREGLEAYGASRPDVVVLDLNLPDGRGLDLLPSLTGSRVVVFSMYEEPAFVTRALEAGALGYVSKNDDPSALVEAVEAAQAGRVSLGRVIAQKLALGSLTGAALDPLQDFTDRDRELVRLLGEGRTLAEAAADLGVSYRTAAAAAARCRQRLGLRSQAALIRFAVEQAGR